MNLDIRKRKVWLIEWDLYTDDDELELSHTFKIEMNFNLQHQYPGVTLY